MNNRSASVVLFSAALLATAAFAKSSDGALQIGLWALAMVEIAAIWRLLARRS
ncbi:hypothetical protein [Streptomyces aureoverticillatus]|uniref:hypothetical protein n=1 Tax=Streptomyces aureoverticillatus TaxID=66871 RepID=UPI0013D9E682|nr:hypothetical protein [Streptomyces aureoverticillatus]QIB45423.1 hypothetical protein G3H79_22465 [Streptomyces aureoverticillatus]